MSDTTKSSASPQWPSREDGQWLVRIHDAALDLYNALRESVALTYRQRYDVRATGGTKVFECAGCGRVGHKVGHGHHDESLQPCPVAKIEAAISKAEGKQ